MINCYSKGLVTGNVDTGGLIGNNTGTVSASYWDKQTSGQATSDGGVGLNTDEMKSIKTYFIAGWDFENIWTINHSVSYPYFGKIELNKTAIAVDDYYTILRRLWEYVVG